MMAVPVQDEAGAQWGLVGMCSHQTVLNSPGDGEASVATDREDE